MVTSHRVDRKQGGVTTICGWLRGSQSAKHWRTSRYADDLAVCAQMLICIMRFDGNALAPLSGGLAGERP